MVKVRTSKIPPPPKPAGRIDRRYELIEVAGRGGMAVVWRALHHGPGGFRRIVAVKQMHMHLEALPLYRDLFSEEARIGSLLTDPNIAQVFDFVSEDNRLYLVMEYVHGIDLATLIRFYSTIRNKRVPWPVVSAVGIGALRGLSAAHERTLGPGEVEPIVHRDVSPHNILVNTKGMAKLIDFGLCFSRDRSIDDTDPGMAKGKLAYLAPEIVRGGRPTPLTDQFAIGSVLWETLTGRRAFEANNDVETYERVANAQIEPLSRHRPDVPKRLREAVHKALSLDPADRFRDTRQMAHALGNILKTHRSSQDLYATLAETVLAIREHLGIGDRTQDPLADDDVSESHSGMVRLLEQDPVRSKGLSRWIPAFLRLGVRPGANETRDP